VNAIALGRACLLCMGVGTVDLFTLNLVVLPQLWRPIASRLLEVRVTPAIDLEGPACMPVSHEALLRRPTEVYPKPLVIVAFPRSSYRVDRHASRQLTDVLEQLHRAQHLTLIGHADASGPAALNERLSAHRASAVARLLAHAGIPRRRMQVEWRGAREPRADGDDKRVEIYPGVAP